MLRLCIPLRSFANEERVSTIYGSWINFFKAIATVAFLGALAGCNVTLQPLPGVKPILLADSAPPQCQFAGLVYVTNDDYSHCHRSNINLLKNQAYALGANLMVISPPQNPDRIIEADAYFCPYLNPWLPAPK